MTILHLLTDYKGGQKPQRERSPPSRHTPAGLPLHKAGEVDLPSGNWWLFVGRWTWLDPQTGMAAVSFWFSL